LNWTIATREAVTAAASEAAGTREAGKERKGKPRGRKSAEPGARAELQPRERGKGES
jgi:hypothetical protein